LEKRNRVLNAHEREVVAHHEMGHALMAMLLPGSDRVHKVSIIPRGVGALGYTIQRPTEDRFLMTRAELENRMAVLLGGRAAEQIVFGETSTGAADDLQKVTGIARSIVMRYGMEHNLGQVVYEDARESFLGTQQTEHGYSEETARTIDRAVRDSIAAVYARALHMLEQQRDLLERSARRLLEKETLDEHELAQIQGELAPLPPA
ncbi:MAG: cell division protein FtsH, partial [Rhodocyclaceae bacterium]|nr:cell division protein FtsH [Rhodocyclaceae bacterium]